MKRRFFLALLILSALIACGSQPLQKSGVSYSSKSLTVTNIDENSIAFRLKDGSFSARGKPVLHAVMPAEHLTLDAGRLDGHINSAAGALADAKLSGGVRGQVSDVSAGSAGVITFTGASVTYIHQGPFTEEGADLHAAGGVTFNSSNPGLSRTMQLKGSQGVFKIRSLNGDVGLDAVDLDGPIVMDYHGSVLDSSKKANPVVGHATAGHLTISRTGEAKADYLIRLSGGVVIRGSLTGPFEDAVVRSPVIDIVVDATGIFKEFWTEGAVDAGAKPVKPAK